MSITALVVDTSYLLELFMVPGHHNTSSAKAIRKKFSEAISKSHRIYVPFTCVFELANHIAGVKDGSIRENLSKKLAETIEISAKENAPWIISSSPERNLLLDIRDLLNLCTSFSKEMAKQCIGLSDTSVIHEARLIKERFSSFGYIVHIWTRDAGMKAYEPDTEINPFL